MSTPIDIQKPQRSVVASPPSEFISPGSGFKSPGSGFKSSSFHNTPVFREDLKFEKDFKDFTLESEGKTKILLLENINQSAVEIFKRHGFEVEHLTKALTEKELIEKIKDFHVIGIRSKSQLTKAVLDSAKKLIAIGCFCIGTNQVDLVHAEKLGIPVFNSPFSNSRSVAELVMGEVIALSRRLLDSNNKMHEGKWEKPKIESCFEIRGKTLGIVGYGHIGSQLSVLAEAMGMKVIFYDVVPLMPLGTAKPVSSLEELLRESDFVTLHVPELESTKNMISEPQLALMKKGSFLINNARGTVVDLKALAARLKSGHLSGAAVDVFPVEPESNGPGFSPDILGCSNVIMTPHIGGSTEEAQRAIGTEVGNTLSRFIKFGGTTGAVNFPELELNSPPHGKKSLRILNVHENVPGVLKQINKALANFSNITKQFSDSTPSTAYLVTDVEISSDDQADVKEIHSKLNQIQESIRTRILY